MNQDWTPTPIPDPTLPPPVAGAQCLRCGYTLDGLSPDARCPECSMPVEESRRGRRLINAAPEYRRTLGLGFMLMFVGYVAKALCIFVATFGPLALMSVAVTTSLISQYSSLVFELVIIAGCWLVTTPDPAGGDHTQSGHARRPARIALACLSVAVLVTLSLAVFRLSGAISLAGISPQSFGGSGALGLGLLAVGGVLVWLICRLVCCILMSQYLMQLALRLPDRELHDFARLTTWLFPVVYIVGSFCCQIGPIAACTIYAVLAARFRFHASGAFRDYDRVPGQA